jgi:hypothetical protein
MSPGKTYILVDTEHFKVDWLGPLGIVKDVIRRNVESPWFLVLSISLVTFGNHLMRYSPHPQADHTPH